MNDILLIYNERSGTFDPAVVEAIETAFAQAQRPIGHKHAIGEDPLPTRREIEAAGIDLVAVLSGDGSLSTIAKDLEGWGGTVLILPGGTMNLLSRALHGDLSPTEIVDAYLAGQGTVIHTPILRAGEIIAYTGMIVGPTAVWGDVREDMRNLDVAALGASVPRAIAATLDDSAVQVEGRKGDYPAIFLEPSQEGIRSKGILAQSAGDLFRHGWAWLMGDFREGPSEALGTVTNLTIMSNTGNLDLLVDGEKVDAADPFTVQADRSQLRFHAVLGEAAWR